MEKIKAKVYLKTDGWAEIMPLPMDIVFDSIPKVGEHIYIQDGTINPFLLKDGGANWKPFLDKHYIDAYNKMVDEINSIKAQSKSIEDEDIIGQLSDRIEGIKVALLELLEEGIPFGEYNKVAEVHRVIEVSYSSWVVILERDESWYNKFALYEN